MTVGGMQLNGWSTSDGTYRATPAPPGSTRPHCPPHGGWTVTGRSRTIIDWHHCNQSTCFCHCQIPDMLGEVSGLVEGATGNSFSFKKVSGSSEFILLSGVVWK